MIPSNFEAALSGLSAGSRRVYRPRIQQWLDRARGAPLDREHVESYMRSLELESHSAQVQNQSLAALKRVAVEAARLGWIDAQAAAQVQEIKFKPTTEIRTGRWLNAAQSSALLVAPDRKTLTGRRDAAVIALLLGCGLQRAEACALAVEQVRTMRDRMLIVDLVGKGGRMRIVAVPQWAALDIQRWIEELKVLERNYVLRSITQTGAIKGSLSPAAVRDIVQRYGAMIGIPDLTPHDLRRSHSRMARLGGAPIEVIQRTLGHASVRTTELYLQAGEEANAGDFIDIEPATPPMVLDPPRSLSARDSQSHPQPEPPADPPQPPTAALPPRRAPGISGRRPTKYPELSFQVLSRTLGLNSTYVGRVLNGVSRPSMQVAERLAALMGWSLDQVNALYKGNKPKPSAKNHDA